VLERITPVLLTYNEEANIGRTLERLKWASEIVVVDSMSTDETPRLAQGNPQVRFFQRDFDSHAAQWNFAVAETAIKTEWILALDADYLLSEDIVVELGGLKPAPDTKGYWASFRYFVAGRPLRGAIYPPILVLFRKRVGRYVQDGHTQRLEVEGRTEKLKGKIFHDDRKPQSRWLASQRYYARLEAEQILAAHRHSLSRTDRIRRMGWPAPILVFFYTLLLKRCLLDGWPGWLYVLQRTAAETMIAIEIVDRRLHGGATSPPIVDHQ
jgi:glycosyltransferase involved in cell wall biosynthesis